MTTFTKGRKESTYPFYFRFILTKSIKEDLYFFYIKKEYKENINDISLTMHFLANNGYHYHAFSCTSVFFNEIFFLVSLYLTFFLLSLMWGKNAPNYINIIVCLFV